MQRRWAEEFTRQASEAARRRCELSGADPVLFTQSVLDGLELGAQRFPGDPYLERDNAIEGIEESRDAAAYALMEYDAEARDLDAGADPSAIAESREWLAAAVILAAQLDYAFRMARYYRREAR